MCVSIQVQAILHASHTMTHTHTHTNTYPHTQTHTHTQTHKKETQLYMHVYILKDTQLFTLISNVHYFE